MNHQGGRPAFAVGHDCDFRDAADKLMLMLMLIEQRNTRVGLPGKQLEALVVDPASGWPLFAEWARELLTMRRSM